MCGAMHTCVCTAGRVVHANVMQATPREVAAERAEKSDVVDVKLEALGVRHHEPHDRGQVRMQDSVFEADDRRAAQRVRWRGGDKGVRELAGGSFHAAADALLQSAECVRLENLF